MKEIDSKAFNATVVKQIEKIKISFDSELTPENFMYFTFEDIDRDRDALGDATGQSLLYSDIKDIAYDYNVNINSVEVSRIRTAIQYLKANKTQIIEEIFEFNPYDGMTATAISDKDDIKYKHCIKVPDNFDGRNCFVEYTISTAWKEKNKSKISKKLRDRVCFISPEKFAVAYSNGAKKDERKSLVSMKIYKNKHEVAIDFRYPNRNITKVDGGTYKFIDADQVVVKGRAIFWRNV